MTDMVEMAAMAVESAKFWELDLDYSAESLEKVDALMQVIFMGNLNQPLPEHILDNVSGMFGAYVGEVLLRCGLKDLGFAWMEGDEGEIGIGMEDFWAAPVNKVYKRITQGPYHNLTDFFEIVFGMAIGAVNMDDPRIHVLSEGEAV